MDELVEAATAVHGTLGLGFTETVYQSSLVVELSNRGVEFATEGTIPIFYNGKPVGQRRPDLFVESDDGTVIVELKTGSNRGEAQLLQYIDLLGGDKNFDIHKGMLIQFNEDLEITEKKINNED